MKQAKFQYKCRLCNKIEGNLCIDEKYASINLIEAVISGRDKTGGLMLISIHNCKDGNKGVSDLIGYIL